MTSTRPNRCLWPTQHGGLCQRPVQRLRDRCRQHGGRYVHELARRFKAGESPDELVDWLVEQGATASRDKIRAYVEQKIREAL